MKMVKDFVEGDRFTNLQLLVSNVSKGVNNNGAGYLNVELRDSSASISGKKWDASVDDDQIFVPGNVVAVDFDVIKYKDSLQTKIYNATRVDAKDIDIVRLVKNPPIPKEELIKRFNKHVASIKDETCLALLKYFLKKYENKIFDFPAASSIHHEFASGLLTHMTYMADIAEFVCNLYGDIDHDILLTGVLLHDIGKVTELEGPVVYHYSLEGKLLGHISIMASEIRNAANELDIHNEKAVLLEHMVLSHHGQLEFGSPVLPQTKEALILSLIDNMDSKIVIASKALETVQKGEFSQKVYPLDGRIFYKPKE